MKQWIGWLICHALRALERLLPVSCLCLVFWPAMAVAAGWDLLRRRDLCAGRHLPSSLYPRRTALVRAWRFWRQRLTWRMAMLARYWPDRLRQPRWQRRCRWVGRERLEHLLAQGRPVILVGLHFGPLPLLRAWLRSCGREAASLAKTLWRQRPAHERWLVGLSDRRNGLAGVPSLFDLSQLRPLHEFLQPGRLLFIAADGARGRQMEVGGEELRFRMATGALRLAARAGARVVPCLIRAERLLRYTIHLGQPVPEPLVADPARHAAAAAHVLREFVPVLRTAVEQCSPGHLDRFRASAAASSPPRTSEGVAA
jgi:lauroyl/myristoyl acyltransferase